MNNNSYWADFNKAVDLMDEEIKTLQEKLDRTEKQRNALIIALNYVNNTINTMDECWKYNPKYAKRFYKNLLEG